MDGLGFVCRNPCHAVEHGLALVGVEADIGGNECAVDADAGVLAVAGFAGVFVGADIYCYGFQLRAGQYFGRAVCELSPNTWTS